jgi:GNAT superfamily N-acetyltransferase
MALIAIPPGHVGAVVTQLEMTRRPALPSPGSSPLRIVRWADPEPEAYRQLFRRVGGPWLWYSRLAMRDDALRAAIREVHVVEDVTGALVGMIELDFTTPGECLIRFLGLVPELAGQGHGKWLLHAMLEEAWRKDVARVHLTTCSLDHPAALPSYLRVGFRAVGRLFESFPDPRLIGLLPETVAPQIPLVRGVEG